jgi:Concanavalin A-like lectin/glucanases superfamily
MRNKVVFIAVLFLTNQLLFAQFIMPSLRSVNSKSNLIMDLDFTNANSYSGSGTSVYDVMNTSSIAASLTGSSIFNSYPKSVTFNGTNQYMLVTSDLSTKFSAVTSGLNSSFTITIWMNPTNTNGNGVVLTEFGSGNTSSGWHDAQIVLVNGTLKFALWPYSIGTPFISSSIATPANNWYMVSMTYDGAVINAYVNGVLAGTYGTLSSPFARQVPYNYGYGLYYCLACSDATSLGSTANGPFSLGRFKVYSTALNANDLLALYTSEKANFATYIGTSSTTLTGTSVTTQTPFANGNAYSLGGSVSSYVSIPGQSGFDLGTGDYTIEWFQYETDTNSFPRPFWYGSSPTYGVSLEGGTFYFWPAGSANSLGSLGTWKNTWVHFAIVRISSKLYVYKNGTLISSATGITNTTNHTDVSSNFIIGAKPGGLTSEQFAGYITNFRIVKGLGVYTGNFTVPTSPLTGIANANPYGGSNTAAIPPGYTSLLLVP